MLGISTTNALGRGTEQSNAQAVISSLHSIGSAIDSVLPVFIQTRYPLVQHSGARICYIGMPVPVKESSTLDSRHRSSPRIEGLASVRASSLVKERAAEAGGNGQRDGFRVGQALINSPQRRY